MLKCLFESNLQTILLVIFWSCCWSINVHAQKEKRTGYINNQILDWNFSTDGIFHNASQEEVYKKCASKLVNLTLDGFNNTLFAYGQTGAGKTFTMTGTTNSFQHRGIIPRAIAQLYQGINERHEYDITVRISYLEIYNEEMNDLLSTLHPTQKREDLVITEDDQGMTYVKGLACHHAKNEEEALNLLFEGESNRIISQHQLNRRSSRSHCILTIYVECHSRTQSNTKFTISKFNLVDLAGSERLGKTLSRGETQKEAMYINKSLTFLEQTIIALENKNRHHIPFRQSKLTHVLKDTVGGRCNTVMIGNIWGEESQMEETLSTLRFSARVMNIPNQPAVNSYHDPFLLCKQYEKEIETLRSELAMYDTLTNRNQVNYEPLSDVQIKDISIQVQKYIENDLPEIEVINLRQVKQVFVQFKQIVENTQVEIENKLKEKYTLYEKSENVEKSSVDSAQPVNEKVGLVGETDGNGFGVGRAGGKPALPSSVATARKKNKKIKDTPDNDRRVSPPTSMSNQNQGEQKSALDDATNTIPHHQSQDQINTPPLKEDAFEMFKTDQGKSLNTVFLENKDILRQKKIEAKSLTSVINETKKDIDDTKEKLNLLQCDKENDAEEVTRDGHVILDEEEFQLIQTLNSLKSKYRTNYEHLQNIRADILYCEQLVKQCRQKLVYEFQNWFKDCFGVSETIESTNKQINSSLNLQEDDGEKFDRVQRELLMKCPESVAFYNARIQTDRRKLFHDTTKKRPGSVTSSIRNAPPNTMLIH